MFFSNYRFTLLLICIHFSIISFAQHQSTARVFKAGAAKSVITPAIGTSINGGFQDRTVRNIHDETYARAIVLDDGENRLAIVVSDLCMIYRETLDDAKRRASDFTGIPWQNMLMSATHTHTAGTACAVFQSTPDSAYQSFLAQRIADAVIRANENRIEARIGWGIGEETSQVFNRRWKLKPGKTAINPFGEMDLVKMNPGVDNPDKLEPAGPVDPQVPVISIISRKGDFIATLANYSLHYVGGLGPGEISADYYGAFNERVSSLLGADHQNVPFVSIMSNGTSGNINNIDFSGRYKQAGGYYTQMNYVANVLAAEVVKVIETIEYQDWISLVAKTDEIKLGVRLPDENDIDRAAKIVEKAEGPNMKTAEEIYARETLLLKDYPTTVQVPLQVLRIGTLAIAAIPCEVFVETGLNIKSLSTIKPVFTISLANGYFGYLPTPEQHALGGYETWRARSSFLEVNASDKIEQTILNLLR
ncbi:MAG: hypothetical protein KDC53_15115 [Saprospiraceae bacterium]|nr:hypothetical protein [Saprospiraceae bacterium]